MKKTTEKKRAFNPAKTWKPGNLSRAMCMYVAQLIRPNTTRVERGIRRGRGKENTVALLQRETGGIKKEIEKEEGGRGGGRFPTPLNFRLCFAQRGAGSSRSSAGDPQALFPCRRLESRVCSPPEAILPANAFLFSPFWSQVAD